MSGRKKKKLYYYQGRGSYPGHQRFRSIRVTSYGNLTANDPRQKHLWLDNAMEQAIKECFTVEDMQREYIRMVRSQAEMLSSAIVKIETEKKPDPSDQLEPGLVSINRTDGMA